MGVHFYHYKESFRNLDRSELPPCSLFCAHAHSTHTLNNKTNRYVHFTIYQVKISCNV